MYPNESAAKAQLVGQMDVDPNTQRMWKARETMDLLMAVVHRSQKVEVYEAAIKVLKPLAQELISGL